MTKWLPDVAPTDRAVDVAARSLQIRLDAVRHYLQWSAERPGEPEHVHQLRVWTRRADAALALYADLLPKRRARRLRRLLRRVRRVAGRVRDCDVFAHGSVGPGAEWPARLLAERGRAHTKLVAVHARLDRGRRLKRRVRKLLDRLRARHAGRPEALAERARARLGPAVAAFFEAIPAESGDPSALHAFRIRAKELRYAMELLAGAFPPGFRDEVYPVVGTLQEKLGLVNDLAVAQDRLQRRADRTGDPAELSDLRRRTAAAGENLARARDDFRRWWTAETRDGLRARFGEFLGSPPAHRET